MEPIVEVKSNLVGRKVEEDSSEEFEDEVCVNVLFLKYLGKLFVYEISRY